LINGEFWLKGDHNSALIGRSDGLDGVGVRLRYKPILPAVEV
jgi:hypothetical protein